MRYELKPYLSERNRGEAFNRLVMPTPENLSDLDSITYEIQTAAGDRIDLIAADYLGDSRLWWVIADLNADRLPDPLNIPDGTVLRIFK